MKSISLCENNFLQQNGSTKDLKEGTGNENGNEDVLKLKNGDTNKEAEEKNGEKENESLQIENKSISNEDTVLRTNGNDSLEEISEQTTSDTDLIGDSESVSENQKNSDDVLNKAAESDENLESEEKTFKNTDSLLDEIVLNSPETVEEKKEDNTKKDEKICDIIDLDDENKENKENVEDEKEKDFSEKDTNKIEIQLGECQSIAHLDKYESWTENSEENLFENDKDKDEIEKELGEIKENDFLDEKNEEKEEKNSEIERGENEVVEDICENEKLEENGTKEKVSEEEKTKVVMENKVESKKNEKGDGDEKSEKCEKLIEGEETDAKEKNKEKESDKNEEEVMEIDLVEELEQMKEGEVNENDTNAQTNIDEDYLNETIEGSKLEEDGEKLPASRKRNMSRDESDFREIKKKKIDLNEDKESISSSSRRSSTSRDFDGASNKDIDLPEPEVIIKEGICEEKRKEGRKLSKDESGVKSSKVKSEVKPNINSSFLASLRGTLKSLTRSDLEELIVQKLCEVITERSNVGELRRKAQILEKDQEKWKAKVQSLTKLVREMEMVLKKYMREVQKQTKDGDPRMVVPFKVTRSVGLQVSFYSGGSKGSKNFLQNLLQQPSKTQHQKKQHHNQQSNQQQTQQQPPTQQQQQQQQQQSIKNTVQNTGGQTIAKSALVKQSPQNSPANKNAWNKPTPSKPSPQPSTKSVPPQLKRLKHVLPKPDQTSPANRSTVSQSYANSNRPHQSPSQGPRQGLKSSSVNQLSSTQVSQQQQMLNNNSKVIDLTDDDDKQPENTGKPSTPIRVVNHLQQQPQVSQNNRFTYILPTTSTPTTGTSSDQNRQVLIATPTTSQPTRPMMCSMPPLLFKGGNPSQPANSQAQISNQQNRGLFSKQLRHPAPLPAPPTYQISRQNLKLLPPRPVLKTSKVPSGIVLSWNMSLGPEHAPISCYQLFAYQESNSPPSTSLWKKVGDVKALPLPMACTLTQFMTGHKYHFAVRAVDLYSRIGPFSFPGTIVLVK